MNISGGGTFLEVNGKRFPLKGFDYTINNETLQMGNSVQDALDHDVPTKKMEVVVEVPEEKRNGDLASEIDGLAAVKNVSFCEEKCPVCGDPFHSKGRLGFNHPLDAEEVDRFCMGENGKDDTEGGLGWCYAHGGAFTSL